MYLPLNIYLDVFPFYIGDQYASKCSLISTTSYNWTTATIAAKKIAAIFTSSVVTVTLHPVLTSSCFTDSRYVIKIENVLTKEVIRYVQLHEGSQCN